MKKLGNNQSHKQTNKRADDTTYTNKYKNQLLRQAGMNFATTSKTRTNQKQRKSHIRITNGGPSMNTSLLNGTKGEVAEKGGVRLERTRVGIDKDQATKEAHHQTHEEAARHVSRISNRRHQGAPHQADHLVPEGCRVGCHPGFIFPLPA